MSNINEINSALIDGGVTDGEHTVFYEDVKSASVTTKRPLRYRIYEILCLGGVFLGGWSILNLFYGGTPTGFGESISTVLSGVFLIAIFGFGFWFFESFSVTSVKTITDHGEVTLHFWQSAFSRQNIGGEVARILNLRRHQPRSPETTDFHYSFREADKFSFMIENETLTVYKTENADEADVSVSDNQSPLICTGEIVAFVDLTNVVRVEMNYRPLCSHDKSIGIRLRQDVVFEFGSGQKSTHYISLCAYSQESWDTMSSWPAKELYQAVTSYLRSRQSSGS